MKKKLILAMGVLAILSGSKLVYAEDPGVCDDIMAAAKAKLDDCNCLMKPSDISTCFDMAQGMLNAAYLCYGKGGNEEELAD